LAILQDVTITLLYWYIWGAATGRFSSADEELDISKGYCEGEVNDWRRKMVWIQEDRVANKTM
jgi:hypothetical protein